MNFNRNSQNQKTNNQNNMSLNKQQLIDAIIALFGSDDCNQSLEAVLEVIEDLNELPKPKKEKKPKSSIKGCSSAYILFCKEHREEAKNLYLEQNGTAASSKEVTSFLASEMWTPFRDNKEDHPQEWEKYQQMAADDRARYNSEKTEKESASGTDEPNETKEPKTKAIKVKDPNSPKKPPSGYQKFMAQMKIDTEYLSDKEDWSKGRIQEDLRKQWKEMDASGKEEWTNWGEE